MGAEYKRRRIIVSRFQYKLLGGDFLHLVVVILLFYGTLFVPIAFTLDDSSLPGSQRDEAARLLLGLQARAWTALPFLLAFCALHSLFVSHRVAGPLFRFKQYFRSLGQGDISQPVRIREKDYLRDEALAINAMVDDVAKRLMRIRAGQAGATAALGALEHALGRETPEEARVRAGELGTRLDELSRSIGEFRLPGEAPGAAAARAHVESREPACPTV